MSAHEDFISDMLDRRCGKPRILKECSERFRGTAPLVIEVEIDRQITMRRMLKAAKADKPTADQAALEQVRVLLADSTWWATAAYGVARDNCEFYAWTGTSWEHRTAQQIIAAMNITDESMDFKSKCLGYLSTLAQVQGPAERDQLGFRLAVINCVIDFQTGEMRPARPEDRLCNVLGRRYLLPHERMERDKNRVYLILRAYSPKVQDLILGSVFPRIAGPWPGGKHIYLIGPAATGKSTLIALIKAVFPGATAAIHADQLKRSQFQSRRLEGMLANLTSENKRSEIKDSETWKDLADMLFFEVEVKHGSAYETRFMATSIKACNLMPYLAGLGSEFWRRLLLIPVIKRLKDTVEGIDDIQRLIRDLSDLELDSVFSEAVDIAIECGPEGRYPADLDDDVIESLYLDLVDGMRLFMQSKIKWGNPGDFVELGEIVDGYRNSDYSIIDRDKGKRDERGTGTLYDLAKRVGVTMGGTVGQRKQAHGNGPLVLFGLTWAATDRGMKSCIMDFLSDCSEATQSPKISGGEISISDVGLPPNSPFSSQVITMAKGIDHEGDLPMGTIMTPKTAVLGEMPCASREIVPPNLSEVANNANNQDDGGYPPSAYEE